MNTVTVEDLIPIGQVIKATGYKGHILVRPFKGYEETWENLKKCVIRANGVLAPFFIEKMEQYKDELEVKFEAYDEDTIAQEILHQEIFVLQEQIIDKSDVDDVAEDDLESWIGYMVKDSYIGELGLIEDVEELPGQFLIHLTYKEKQIAIPFAEELVLDVDVDNKILLMELPDGILDL